MKRWFLLVFLHDSLDFHLVLNREIVVHLIWMWSCLFNYNDINVGNCVVFLLNVLRALTHILIYHAPTNLLWQCKYKVTTRRIIIFFGVLETALPNVLLAKNIDNRFTICVNLRWLHLKFSYDQFTITSLASTMLEFLRRYKWLACTEDISLLQRFSSLDAFLFLPSTTRRHL